MISPHAMNGDIIFFIDNSKIIRQMPNIPAGHASGFLRVIKSKTQAKMSVAMKSMDKKAFVYSVIVEGGPLLFPGFPLQISISRRCNHIHNSILHTCG